MEGGCGAGEDLNGLHEEVKEEVKEDIYIYIVCSVI